MLARMSRLGQFLSHKTAETRDTAGKTWALLPATGLVVGEVAADKYIQGSEALQDDVMVTAGAAFFLDATLTTIVKGVGLDPERLGVRRTIEVVSAYGGALINLFSQGRLNPETAEPAAMPGVVSAAAMAVSGLAGAVLGSSAGRALTR